MFSSIFKTIGLLWLTQLISGVSLGQQKPEVIVLTDIGGDTDDEQSLVRFLYYADQFEIKAICATSRLGHGQDTKPELIKGHLDAYKTIYPNLMLHSKEYPHPDGLMLVVKNGRGNSEAIGEGFDSEASVKSWERFYNFKREVGLIINDRFELYKNEGQTSFHFMSALPVQLKSPGVLETTGEGFTLQTRFDPKKLDATVEITTIEDPKLLHNHGEKLYRLGFKWKEDKLHGDIKFSITSNR